MSHTLSPVERPPARGSVLLFWFEQVRTLFPQLVDAQARHDLRPLNDGLAGYAKLARQFCGAAVEQVQ
jgi:hypothetical protein